MGDKKLTCKDCEFGKDFGAEFFPNAKLTECTKFHKGDVFDWSMEICKDMKKYLREKGYKKNG